MTQENFELQAGNVKEATKDIKSSDLWQVPYDQLHVLPGFNVREDDDEYKAHIENLTQLIFSNGYDRTKPLAGYVAVIEGVSRIVITDGHSRHRAVGNAIGLGAEIKTIPVVTSTRGTSMEDLTVGLVTSNSGKALKPYELGTVIKRLTSFGWEEAKIAGKLNVTTGYVQDLLLLHGASKPIRDMVRTGKVAAGLAISTMKQHGTKALSILQGALETAKAAGKTKASKKDVPLTFKAATKVAGPDLYDGLMWVQNDKGYKGLSKECREYVESLINSLPADPEADK